MESKTKTHFSPELIKTLAQDQFGSGVHIAEIQTLEDGWFNSAYAIHFENHKPDAVLRIAPPTGMRLLRYENDMMRKEIEVNQVLQSYGDIPVPAVLGFNFKRNQIDRDYMFVEKLKGLPYEKIQNKLSEGDKTSIHHQIGEIVARVYAHKGTSWGYPGGGLGCQAATWREAFLDFVFSLLADGEELGVELPLGYGEIRNLFSQKASVLDEVREPVLVHWDMWAGNVFIHYQEGRPKVEGIIDWERAYWGDPESEPMIAVSHYGPAFFEGLGRELTSGEGAENRQCMYRLYLFLVMAIEAKIRFENADHLGWVYQKLAKELQHLLAL